jgi:hypothetical protein
MTCHCSASQAVIPQRPKFRARHLTGLSWKRSLHRGLEFDGLGPVSRPAGKGTPASDPACVVMPLSPPERLQKSRVG